MNEKKKREKKLPMNYINCVAFIIYLLKVSYQEYIIRLSLLRVWYGQRALAGKLTNLKIFFAVLVKDQLDQKEL